MITAKEFSDITGKDLGLPGKAPAIISRALIVDGIVKDCNADVLREAITSNSIIYGDGIYSDGKNVYTYADKMLQAAHIIDEEGRAIVIINDEAYVAKEDIHLTRDDWQTEVICQQRIPSNYDLGVKEESNVWCIEE